MKRPWRPLRLAAAVAVVLSAAGCGSTEGLVRVVDDGLSPGPAPISTASPADVGIDAARIDQALAGLPAETEHGLRSLLVMRYGKLVVERYWNGRDSAVQQDVRSVTKSVTSLLVGVAIDQGFLGGARDPTAKFLGGAAPDATSATARALTIEDLLTMRTGLACDDRDPRSPGHEERMVLQQDWVRFFLQLPTAEGAGAVARYCTAGVVALGRVVSAASGSTVPVFAQTHLFGPLGITGARWSTFDGGRQTDTGGHLHLTPRDMLKVGQLVLQGGMWNGRRLVSQRWIEQSTREHTRIDGGKPYGYLWWRETLPHRDASVAVVFASGNGGQTIFVVPALELVAVSTGGNYNSPKAALPFTLLARAILPAVQPASGAAPSR